MSLAETLLWLCKIKSPIGEERELCDQVTERLQRVQLALPIRRYGESIVVPLTRGNGGPHHPYGVGRTLAGTAPRPQDVERHHVDPQWGQPTCLSPHAQLRDGGALELRSDDNSRTGAG